MVAISKKRDLNAGNIDKDVWNRMDHILRMLSYWQSYISWSDINKDLEGMYQGVQGMLDVLTADFEENGVNKDGKKTVLRGILTTKFQEYRKTLDQANNLNQLSRQPNQSTAMRGAMRNSAYRKLQTLKYSLLQECERLGYNAKKTDTSEAYREGNN